MAGVINVITKSGTNEMHGTLHYFGKDGALSSDASHANLTLKPDFGQHQFGLTLGGPWSRTQNTSPFQHVIRTPKYLTDRDLFRHRDVTR